MQFYPGVNGLVRLRSEEPPLRPKLRWHDRPGRPALPNRRSSLHPWSLRRQRFSGRYPAQEPATVSTVRKASRAVTML